MKKSTRIRLALLLAGALLAGHSLPAQPKLNPGNIDKFIKPCQKIDRLNTGYPLP